MIKELFLPEKIGSWRLYSRRILSVAVSHQEIVGVLIHATSKQTVIEQLMHVPLTSSAEGGQRSASEALKESIKNIKKKYDAIIITIPSSLIVFKELQIPFSNHEKISLILDFEIESMLPFSIQESIADFIITNETKKGAQILAAAIRKQDLQDMLDPYHNAGVIPDVATVDLFALYNLYYSIPEYQTLRNGCALIDLGYESTRIALLDNGQMRLTRHIQQGMQDIATSIGKELNLSLEDSLAQLLNLDMTNIGSSPFARLAQQHFMTLFNDIQFTLNSFSLKLNNGQGVEKILFIGPGMRINHMIPFCNHFLQIPCELFDILKLFAQGQIKNKTTERDEALAPYLIPLGAALQTPMTELFNMRRKDFSKDYSASLSRQLMTSCVVLTLIFGILGLRGYMEIKDLSFAADALEKKEINKLKKIIPQEKMPKKITLQTLVAPAEKVIQEKTNLWAPFTESYISPLEILEDLTKLIDKKMFDVKISSVSITVNQGIPSVVMEGFFKSLTGNDNYAYLSQFKSRFNNAILLELDGDFVERPKEDQGIPFSAKLKPRITI